MVRFAMGIFDTRHNQLRASGFSASETLQSKRNRKTYRILPGGLPSCGADADAATAAVNRIAGIDAFIEESFQRGHRVKKRGEWVIDAITGN